MHIEFREIGSTAVLIVLDGKFNMYTVPSFQGALESELRRDLDVVLHLGRVPHIDSSALGTIIRLQLDLQERGRRLLLVEPSASLLEIFNMTGTAQRFQIFPGEKEALEQI